MKILTVNDDDDLSGWLASSTSPSPLLVTLVTAQARLCPYSVSNFLEYGVSVTCSGSSESQ